MSGIGADGKYSNYMPNSVEIELFLNLFIIITFTYYYFFITINTVIAYNNN